MHHILAAINRFPGLLLLRLRSLLTECRLELLNSAGLCFVFLLIHSNKLLLNALKFLSDIKVSISDLPPYFMVVLQVFKSLIVLVSRIFLLLMINVLIGAYF